MIANASSDGAVSQYIRPLSGTWGAGVRTEPPLFCALVSVSPTSSTEKYGIQSVPSASPCSPASPPKVCLQHFTTRAGHFMAEEDPQGIAALILELARR
ncbi:hypothetical protein [Streptomyces sp. x-19]|uniref:hypothetical protein n=1 Tax=Streptomyces sp. x-19 TaxID=2789280 RepID=UPI00397F6B12